MTEGFHCETSHSKSSKTTNFDRLHREGVKRFNKVLNRPSRQCFRYVSTYESVIMHEINLNKQCQKLKGSAWNLGCHEKEKCRAKCKRCKLIKRWECQKVYEKTRAFYSIKQIEDLISTHSNSTPCIVNLEFKV